ncbi:sugar-binding transcriptional regulator [Jannaschia sp. R86511]|uniref:sugar-binding transcriptional regulator n=1 Tax=Jannaschia sp. R86511 TaxID=3093853 RepID=UPI0036D2CDEC
MTDMQQAGPARLVLTASVARRYYIDGRSKVEIAEEFRLSRFKIARLLDEARETGLVRIEIGHAGAVDVGLSDQVQQALGLRHVVVVDTPEEDPASLRAQLGTAAAQLLTEIVTADDVLGLAWARSVSAMGSALTSLAPCSVVQLTGALSGADVHESSIELVREVAKIAGGPASYFYAPLIVPDAATARALRQQPEVARAMDLIPSVTIAVAGVGGWGPGQSTVYDAIDAAERDSLRAGGVRADISGILLDADAVPVRTPLTERMIGITAEQMLAIPEVIAIAYQTSKTEALRLAVRSGLVGGLVTHTAVARELLEQR